MSGWQTVARGLPRQMRWGVLRPTRPIKLSPSAPTATDRPSRDDQARTARTDRSATAGIRRSDIRAQARVRDEAGSLQPPGSRQGASPAPEW